MPRWPERVPIGDASDARGFEVLIARYLESIRVRGYSETTIASGVRILRGFGVWCEERGIERPVEVTRSMVERYQRWLYHYRRPDGRTLAMSTQKHRLVRVKTFFSWLARERYLLYNPAAEIELPKQPAALPAQGFTVAEVEQILSGPNVGEPVGLRDRAILETLYSTGIRRTELVRLDLYDLDREHGWLRVRQGKGGRGRVVPIGERAQAWVVRYVEDARPRLLGEADEWALFVTTDGERFTPGGCGNRVSHLIRDSEIRQRAGACHLFRHTMATQMLAGGADIRFIQEMLGHANLKTTQIYTRVSIDQLKAIHSATHPAAKVRGPAGSAEAEKRAGGEEEGAG